MGQENTAKKKARFNIVDVVVILLIIALIGVIAIKLFGSKATEVVSQKVDCYAEVCIIGAVPRLYNEIERQDLIGQRMVSGNEYLTATIEDWWMQPYDVDAIRDDGVIVNSISPDKMNVYFLVKTEVAPDTPSPKIGSQELRVGRTFLIKTQTFECSGVIYRVEIGEYTGNGTLQE